MASLQTVRRHYSVALPSKTRFSTWKAFHFPENSPISGAAARPRSAGGGGRGPGLTGSCRYGPAQVQPARRHVAAARERPACALLGFKPEPVLRRGRGYRKQTQAMLSPLCARQQAGLRESVARIHPENTAADENSHPCSLGNFKPFTTFIKLKL